MSKPGRPLGRRASTAMHVLRHNEQHINIAVRAEVITQNGAEDGELGDAPLLAEVTELLVLDLEVAGLHEISWFCSTASPGKSSFQQFHEFRETSGVRGSARLERQRGSRPGRSMEAFNLAGTGKESTDG